MKRMTAAVLTLAFVLTIGSVTALAQAEAEDSRSCEPAWRPCLALSRRRDRFRHGGHRRRTRNWKIGSRSRRRRRTTAQRRRSHHGRRQPSAVPA